MRYHEIKTLLEARNYEDLFNKFIATLPSDDAKTRMKTYIARHVAWAKLTLKKYDRIDWFLKEFRSALIKNEDIRPLEQELNHYYSQNIPAIESFRIPPGYPRETLFNKLSDLEDLHIRRMERKFLEPSSHHEKLIDFNDGFAWWNLNQPSCREEANAMGHCGNSGGRNCTILSLREQTEEGLVPHLTFILHDNGELGEMKGRHNNKPSARYHKYIIPLLLNDAVTEVVGGGYKPENNFALDDLPDTQRIDLIKKKPSLASIMDIWELSGDSPALHNKIDSFFTRLYAYNKKRTPTFDSNRDVWVLASMSLDDWVENYGNDTAKYINKYWSGAETEYYDINIDDSSIQHVLDVLGYSRNGKLDVVIERYMRETYPDDIEEDDHISLELIEELDQPLYEQLKFITEQGYNDGTAKNAIKEMLSALENANITPSKTYVGSDGKGHPVWDSPFELVMTTEQLINFFKHEASPAEIEDQYGNILDTMNEMANDGLIACDETYYGFIDFEMPSKSDCISMLSEVIPEQYFSEATNAS